MIRVLLAEDQAMVRGALTALLGMESDIEVVGSAADGTAITFKHPVVQVRRSFLPCWWLMLEAEIKPLVITAGLTIKTPHMMAVYSKPGFTWDGDKLEGYAADHPEVLNFRKPKAASVAFRAVK